MRFAGLEKSRAFALRDFFCARSDSDERQQRGPRLGKRVGACYSQLFQPDDRNCSNITEQ